jgi:hypothetical protein
VGQRRGALEGMGKLMEGMKRLSMPLRPIPGEAGAMLRRMQCRVS